MQAPPLPSTMYLLASYFRCVGFYHMQITPPTCSVHGGFGQERTPDSSWYAESLHMAAGTVLVLILPPFLGKSFYLSSASSNSPSELCCLIHAPSMGGVGWELHGATQGGSFLFSFQLFLCLEQEVQVTHRFSLHLSFFPFPPTIIKQRHMLEMLGILPEVCACAKKHQPVWWSTRACLLNSSHWAHDAQVNFLPVPRAPVSSGELLAKI